MHGANWAAAKDKYEALLGNIADIEELQNVIMEMIGEINSSHTGISGGTRLPGDQNRPERIATRYPGFDIRPILRDITRCRTSIAKVRPITNT